MGRAGCSNTLHWTTNDALDLQRAMSMKISVENGKICNQAAMGERLVRTSEVRIVDETNCFRLDFIEKILEHRPRYGNSTQEKVKSEICI